MRLAATAPFLCLCACTLTTAEPQIHVAPYLAVYRLRGDTSMQSQPTPSGPGQDNAPQTMRTFGQDHHREDVGVRVDIGDGFGGFRVDYYRLDMGTAETGVLTADWGALRAGDVVQMSAAMDEVRLGYLEPFVDVKSEYRDHPLRVRFAAGGVFAYRGLDLRARTEDGSRTQGVSIHGDVLYPALRAQVAYRDVSLDVEYAIAPDALVLGGDFDGVQQDFEARIGYSLPMRDITFYGGYRYSEVPAEGTEGGLRYDADLVIDGFQFGVRVTF